MSQLVRVFAVSFACAIAGSALCQAAQRRPNFLVILSDDVGWAEYGFQGGKDIPTPNIDSIAKSGVRFTQGYVSGPVLQPHAGRPDDRPLPDPLRPRVQQRRKRRAGALGNDDRRSAQVARLRHVRHRQVAPGRPRRSASSDEARLRRVLRHAGQHALLSPAAIRRLARFTPAAGGCRRGLLHDRRLRGSGRRLAGEAQGPAVVPVLALQRPARAAASAAKVSRPRRQDRGPAAAASSPRP